jgi:cytoskeletal protein CcmA (bactofilin family)
LISAKHLRLLVLGATLALALAPPAVAQRGPGGREAVARDLGADRFAAGAAVSIVVPVAGDLAAAGGNVDVSAEVGGDAVIAGGNVRVGAPVRHGLYAAGGRVAVNGPVQRNARIAGGTVEIGPDGRIAGNVSVGAGEIRVAGSIDGYLQAAGGYVFIDGTVGGDVEVGSGAVELGPNARIGGRMRYASRDELRRDAGAQVRGGVERLSPRTDWPVRGGLPEPLRRGIGWVWSAGLLIAAAVLAAALPGVCAGVGATVRARWAMSLLIGFIALVCIPAAAMLGMMTLVGLPLALAGIALYLALLLAGYVAAGISLGEFALQRFQAARASRIGWRVMAAALGMLAISLLGRLPWVGGLVVFAALLLGVGALLMQLAPGRATSAG